MKFAAVAALALASTAVAEEDRVWVFEVWRGNEVLGRCLNE
jgi:hypothetical protein